MQPVWLICCIYRPFQSFYAFISPKRTARCLLRLNPTSAQGWMVFGFLIQDYFTYCSTFYSFNCCTSTLSDEPPDDILELLIDSLSLFDALAIRLVSKRFSVIGGRSVTKIFPLHGKMLQDMVKVFSRARTIRLRTFNDQWLPEIGDCLQRFPRFTALRVRLLPLWDHEHDEEQACPRVFLLTTLGTFIPPALTKLKFSARGRGSVMC